MKCIYDTSGQKRYESMRLKVSRLDLGIRADVGRMLE